MAYAAWHYCVKRSVEASSRAGFDLRKLSKVITQGNIAVRKKLGRIAMIKLEQRKGD